MKIGVFDSGIGGERIAKLLQLEFPDFQIVNVSDKENLPYGNKTVSQLKELVVPKIQQMEKSGCNLIVIACNTVTTNIINEVRKAVKVPVVGFEPMIKPAASFTKTGTIIVCATPSTLNSKRYKHLKSQYARNLKIIEPDCSKWANLIEDNKLNRLHLQKIIEISNKNNADILVLGCTHYHWIEQILYDSFSSKVTILQPEEAIIRRIKMLLSNI